METVDFYLQAVTGERFAGNGSRKYTSLAKALRAAKSVANAVGCDVYVNKYVDGFGGDCVEIVNPTSEEA